MSATVESHSKHDIARLEGCIRELQANIRDMAQEDDLIELLRIIHFPGWTTPAELQLVLGLVETINNQVNSVQAMKQTLMNGSRMVGGG